MTGAHLRFARSSLSPALLAVLLLWLAAHPAAAETLFPPEWPAATLDGTNGFTIIAYWRYNHLGTSVAGNADFNGDGIDDILIGARGDEFANVPGRAHLIFGAPGLGADGTVDVRALDGTNGFEFIGPGPLARTGISVDLGDVNGDGLAEAIIGAEGAWSSNGAFTGEVYVIFGRREPIPGGRLTDDDLDGTVGFRVAGLGSDDLLGLAVACAGDINADGIDDLVLAAPGVNRGPSNSGEVYVIFGAPDLGRSGRVPLSQIDGDNGFVIDGFQTNMFLGRELAGLGDINADGIDDFAIACNGAELGGQTVYTFVIFGHPDIGASGTFDLTALDGTNGFVIPSVPEHQQPGFFALADGADLNGDGISDLALSSENEQNFYAYVDAVFGHPGIGQGGMLDLGTVAPPDGFRVRMEYFGVVRDLAIDADVNDDLHVDVIGGDDLNGGNYGGDGGAYVLFTPPALGTDGIITIEELNGANGLRLLGYEHEGSYFGTALANAGDVNADGIDDILVGAPLFDRRGTESGEAYVFFGRSLRPFGDFDRDGDIDLADFNTFAACYRGAGVPVTDECKIADLDGDTDADLTDFATFSAYFTGPR